MVQFCCTQVSSVALSNPQKGTLGYDLCPAKMVVWPSCYPFHYHYQLLHSGELHPSEGPFMAMSLIARGSLPVWTQNPLHPRGGQLCGWHTIMAPKHHWWCICSTSCGNAFYWDRPCPVVVNHWQIHHGPFLHQNHLHHQINWWDCLVWQLTLHWGHFVISQVGTLHEYLFQLAHDSLGHFGFKRLYVVL